MAEILPIRRKTLSNQYNNITVTRSTDLYSYPSVHDPIG